MEERHSYIRQHVQAHQRRTIEKMIAPVTKMFLLQWMKRGEELPWYKYIVTKIMGDVSVGIKVKIPPN